MFEVLTPEQTGINFENRLTEDLAHNSVNDVYFYNGSGLSIADFNNDGLQDIYFVSAQQANALYLNQGNDQNGIPVFVDEASKYNLDIDMYSTQAAFFDYDLDGDLDMVLANHHQVDYSFAELSTLLRTESTETGERLYQNQDGKYVDVSVEAGLINNMLRSCNNITWLFEDIV